MEQFVKGPRMQMVTLLANPLTQEIHSLTQDNMRYLVADRAMESYSANLIAENMYSEIDEQDCSHAILNKKKEHQFNKDSYEQEILHRAKQNGSNDNTRLPSY